MWLFCGASSIEKRLINLNLISYRPILRNQSTNSHLKFNYSVRFVFFLHCLLRLWNFEAICLLISIWYIFIFYDTNKQFISNWNNQTQHGIVGLIVSSERIFLTHTSEKKISNRKNWNSLSIQSEFFSHLVEKKLKNGFCGMKMIYTLLSPRSKNRRRKKMYTKCNREFE